MSDKNLEEKFGEYCRLNKGKAQVSKKGAYLEGYYEGRKELEAQLKEAEEVIEFYAKKSIWGKSTPHCLDSIDPCDSEQLEGDNYGITRGGKRAREYIQKYSKGNK